MKKDDNVMTMVPEELHIIKVAVCAAFAWLCLSFTACGLQSGNTVLGSTGFLEAHSEARERLERVRRGDWRDIGAGLAEHTESERSALNEYISK